MPQLFQVLRCYKCLVFQVHQTKKSNKWECKLCGEKQSIKRHYGLGTAKDCRLHVQKLNGMRGEIDGLKNNIDTVSDSSENEDNVIKPIKNKSLPLKDSKWSNYIEEIENIDENTNDKMTLGDTEVVLEIPIKQRKRFHNNTKRYPKTSTTDHVDIQENETNEIASPLIAPIATNHTVSVHPKTPQLSSHSENQIAEVEPLKNEYHNMNKFIPPTVNKNSKWAQFTDEADESKHIDIVPSQSIEISQNNELFSLCDDTDLDNILNI